MRRDEDAAQGEPEAVFVLFALLSRPGRRAEDALDFGGLHGAAEGAGGEASDDFAGGFARVRVLRDAARSFC